MSYESTWLRHRQWRNRFLFFVTTAFPAVWLAGELDFRLLHTDWLAGITIVIWVLGMFVSSSQWMWLFCPRCGKYFWGFGHLPFRKACASCGLPKYATEEVLSTSH